MILFGVWAPTEKTFWDTWIAAGICSAPNEYLPPYKDNVDTTAPIWDGLVYRDGEIIPGWHCNVRVYGALEDLMRGGLPRLTPENTEPRIWENTHVHQYFQLTLQPADPETGFPAGYRSASGVTYADVRDFSQPVIIFV